MESVPILGRIESTDHIFLPVGFAIAASEIHLIVILSVEQTSSRRQKQAAIREEDEQPPDEEHQPQHGLEPPIHSEGSGERDRQNACDDREDHHPR